MKDERYEYNRLQSRTSNRYFKSPSVELIVETFTQQKMLKVCQVCICVFWFFFWFCDKDS